MMVAMEAPMEAEMGAQTEVVMVVQTEVEMMAQMVLVMAAPMETHQALSSLKMATWDSTGATHAMELLNSA